MTHSNLNVKKVSEGLKDYFDEIFHEREERTLKNALNKTKNEYFTYYKLGIWDHL